MLLNYKRHQSILPYSSARYHMLIFYAHFTATVHDCHLKMEVNRRLQDKEKCLITELHLIFASDMSAGCMGGVSQGPFEEGDFVRDLDHYTIKNTS